MRTDDDRRAEEVGRNRISQSVRMCRRSAEGDECAARDDHPSHGADYFLLPITCRVTSAAPPAPRTCQPTPASGSSDPPAYFHIREEFTLGPSNRFVAPERVALALEAEPRPESCPAEGVAQHAEAVPGDVHRSARWQCPLCAKKQTFRPLLDIIVGGQGYSSSWIITRETYPPTISASDRRRCCDSGFLTYCIGRNLSDAARYWS